MSDCNARGREFKSRSGQNKFTKKVMGSDGKIVNIYPCSVCPMLSMRSVMVYDCII